MLPSGPAVIPVILNDGESENSVTTPVGVMRPMPLASVNQMFPSAPAVIVKAPAEGVESGNSVMTPAGVMRPIWSALDSVNQRLPSGPTVIPAGPALGVGSGNSVIV